MCQLILFQRMLPLGRCHRMLLLVVRCSGRVQTFKPRPQSNFKISHLLRFPLIAKRCAGDEVADFLHLVSFFFLN